MSIIKKLSEITKFEHVNGIKTGFITHDYNDNGLKPGCLTIVTGKTGSGKTTYVRQVFISCAMQQIPCYMFMGETSLAKERDKLTRLVADIKEISSYYGLAGAKHYKPTDLAVNQFVQYFEPYMYMSDNETLKNQKDNTPKFVKIYNEMKRLITEKGVKLFILDNMMMLCEKNNAALFAEQKNIIIALKTLAEETKTHVILVAHPKKGDGDQDISGATEIMNECDTIIRYIRISEEEREILIKRHPNRANLLDKVSAKLKVEKIRDEGTNIVMWLEWIPERGALYDISELQEAEKYEETGFWTKALNKNLKKDIYF